MSAVDQSELNVKSVAVYYKTFTPQDCSGMAEEGQRSVLA